MDYIKRLEQLMTRLRGRGGCPWDRRQTHKSLKPYLLEEAHETLEAIDLRDDDLLREELGDLLLQVAFHAQLAKERGAFRLQDVAKTIGDKLVRRHPHVFGRSSRRISDINRKWEELKRQEKPGRRSALDGLPKSLPALLRAQRMHEKTLKHSPRGSADTGLNDFEEAWKRLFKGLKGRKGKRSDLERTAGEFLLILTRLANDKGFHAEMALRKAALKFERDFRRAEKGHSGRRPHGTS